MGSTKIELVQELRKKPACSNRDRLIELCLEGRFHDYESDLELPKHVLEHTLETFGYADLAALVRDGAYDEEPTEAQKEELRQLFGAQAVDALYAPENLPN